MIFTNLNERFFQPSIGSNIKYALFEMNDSINEDTIEFLVTNTIENNEKRVNLIGVNATIISDHELGIKIIYTLINNPEPVTLNLVLKRIR